MAKQNKSDKEIVAEKEVVEASVVNESKDTAEKEKETEAVVLGTGVVKAEITTQDNTDEEDTEAANKEPAKEVTLVEGKRFAAKNNISVPDALKVLRGQIPLEYVPNVEEEES